MLVEVQSITKNFGQLQVLKDVSFSLERSQVLALVGSSGSGKTTLLRCVNGLEQVEEGTIHLLDRQFQLNSASTVTNQLRQRVGMVFQGFNLWPHLTVLQNLTLAPEKVLKMKQHDAGFLARELLAQFGLLEKLGSYPAKLSGGQQQRVAIARAMMMRPELLLLDEVTSALDPETAWEVLEAIRQVTMSGTAIIMSTHNISFAREIADKAIFLDKGRIVESGDAKSVLTTPTHIRTQQFLRQVAGTS